MRAYDSVGVKDLQGLLAPFLIDSYALERKVLASQIPARVLSGVTPLGVHGIALLPGPLQHILSIGSPMLAPSDYQAQPIAIHRSEAAASTIRALGTTSVELAPDDVAPRIRGIETDLVDLLANRHNEITADETLASNVTFWPRVTSIVINDKAFAALTGAQQRALQACRSVSPRPIDDAPRARRTQGAERACARTPIERGSLAFLVGDPVAACRAAHARWTPCYRRLARVRHDAWASSRPIEAMKRASPPRPPLTARRAACTVSASRPTGAPARCPAISPRRAVRRGTVDVTSKDLGTRPADRSRVRFGLRVQRARRAPGHEVRGAVRGRHAARMRGQSTFVAGGARGACRWLGGPGAISDGVAAGLRRVRRAVADRSPRGHRRGRSPPRARAAFVTDVPTGLPC